MVGVPDEILGERVFAVIALRTSSSSNVNTDTTSSNSNSTTVANNSTNSNNSTTTPTTTTTTTTTNKRIKGIFQHGKLISGKGCLITTTGIQYQGCLLYTSDAADE